MSAFEHLLSINGQETDEQMHGCMGDLLVKNYKLQNTNYKQIPNYNVQNYKQKDNKKFLQGVQGGSFYKKRPPGRRRQLQF